MEEDRSPAPPESPSRRRLFTAVAAGASALVAAGLGGPLVALALAPLRKPKGEAEGRAELGALERFASVKEGKPEEVVLSRTIEDGYTTRRIKERFYVVSDASGPEGLAVLDTTCTHLGCGVSWNAERKAFLCPCHGGVYAVDGRVIGGPPPRPLARLPLVVDGGRLSLDTSKLA